MVSPENMIEFVNTNENLVREQLAYRNYLIHHTMADTQLTREQAVGVVEDYQSMLRSAHIVLWSQAAWYTAAGPNMKFPDPARNPFPYASQIWAGDFFFTQYNKENPAPEESSLPRECGSVNLFVNVKEDKEGVRSIQWVSPFRDATRDWAKSFDPNKMMIALDKNSAVSKVDKTLNLFKKSLVPYLRTTSLWTEGEEPHPDVAIWAQVSSFLAQDFVRLKRYVVPRNPRRLLERKGYFIPNIFTVEVDFVRAFQYCYCDECMEERVSGDFEMVDENEPFQFAANPPSESQHAAV